MIKTIHTTRTSRWATFLAVAFIVAVLLALPGCAHDDTDPPNGSSGMGLRTDHGTGCQYLTSAGFFGETGITPRLGRDGKQVCK